MRELDAHGMVGRREFGTHRLGYARTDSHKRSGYDDGGCPMGCPNLRLTLFDGWRLVDGEQMVYPPARGQRLVALLALRGRQARAQLAGALWPNADERRADASLRAALSTLHRQLPGLVEKDHGEVQLTDRRSEERRVGKECRSV